MEAKGIIRHVDDLGRIVIPIEIRKRMNIAINDSLQILQRGNKIEISKQAENVCKCGAVLENSYKFCPYCGKENKIEKVKD